MIERWRASELPLATFARLNGVHPRTLWGWVHEPLPSVPTAAPTFVPVQVVQDPRSDETESAGPAIAVEIVLPRGPRLRVADGASPAWVAAVVRALQAAC